MAAVPTGGSSDGLSWVGGADAAALPASIFCTEATVEEADFDVDFASGSSLSKTMNTATKAEGSNPAMIVCGREALCHGSTAE